MLKSMTFRSSLAAMACAISLSAHAIADAPTPVNIPAGALVPALEELEKQATIELIFQPEQLKSFHTDGVQGTYEPQQAIRILLKNTPLELRTDSSGAMVIAPPAFDSATNGIDPSGQTAGAAPVAQGSLSQAAAMPKSETLEEVVVTAQKREERLQDVPVPVTAISADTLSENNQVRLQDYYQSVPGLSLASDGLRPGAATIAIRGITTGGYGNPTVGITVDDVPYGSSTLQGGGIYAPDIDPSDLLRVEVLRGPQGTLYGASSMGGTLKFVTVDPSTAGFDARVQADINSIYASDGPGYGTRAAANLPLGETLALRASGFARHDAGYIDDVLTDQHGVNSGNSVGGRLSALWRPSEMLSVKLSALYQDLLTHGSPLVFIGPGFADLQQAVVRRLGGYRTKSTVYSAIVTARLGTFDLTAVSGYSVNRRAGSDDFDGQGTAFFDNNRTSKFTQEMRLSAPIGTRINWLLGAFYTYESSQWHQDVVTVDPNSGDIVGTPVINGSFPTTYTEYAAFTNLTVALTHSFDIQFGGRESHNQQTYMPFEDGSAFGSTLPALTKQDSQGTAFTYLVTPRFKLSANSMVYVRMASGYRAGGPNTPGPDVPSEFSPDRTVDYEIGLKSDEFAHKLSFDASLYYINWRDIQLPLAIGDNSYTANGGKAKSQGLELSVQSRPLTGLKMAAWITLGQAQLTQAVPPGTLAAGLYGVAGNRLPYSSRLSAYFSAEQEFPLGAATGFAGASVSYVGDREGGFTAGPQRQDLPGYAKTDIHGGVRYLAWTMNAYLNNATNRRGLIQGGLGGSIYPYSFTTIEPRTVGMTVTRNF